MSTIFKTVLIALLVVSCNTTKKVTNTHDDSAITEVVYNATTRGSSKNITVVNQNVFYKTQDTSKSSVMNSEEQQALNETMAAIDVTTLSSLTAPSNKHLFDGAMHATVTVKKGDNIYTSATFDHGNPPEALKSLVNLLLSFEK